MLKQVARNATPLLGPHAYCDQVKLLDSHTSATKPNCLILRPFLSRNKANLFKYTTIRANFSHVFMQKTEAMVR